MKQTTLYVGGNMLALAFTVAAFLIDHDKPEAARAITEHATGRKTIKNEAGEKLDLLAVVTTEVEAAFPVDESGKTLYFGQHHSLPDRATRWGLWQAEVRDQYLANKQAEADAQRKREERAAAKIAEAKARADKLAERQKKLAERIEVDRRKLEALQSKATPAAPSESSETTPEQGTEPPAAPLDTLPEMAPVEAAA